VGQIVGRRLAVSPGHLCVAGERLLDVTPAAAPSAGTARPTSSPTAPAASRMPNGTIHFVDTRTRSAS
jgi:hypothetical protein